MKNKYKEAFLACSDIKMMAEWVNRNVETSLNTISEFSVEKIEKCIKEWVNNNLPKITLFRSCAKWNLFI